MPLDPIISSPGEPLLWNSVPAITTFTAFPHPTPFRRLSCRLDFRTTDPSQHRIRAQSKTKHLNVHDGQVIYFADLRVEPSVIAARCAEYRRAEEDVTVLRHDRVCQVKVA